MRENPFYYKINFDPYRNLYYRLSSPPRPNSTEENFHYVNYNRICLTVLDKDFQVLDHIFLPKENVYNVGFSFVTSEGLWISYNGSNQDDENWIKGDVIQLDKVVNWLDYSANPPRVSNHLGEGNFKEASTFKAFHSGSYQDSRSFFIFKGIKPSRFSKPQRLNQIPGLGRGFFVIHLWIQLIDNYFLLFC